MSKELDLLEDLFELEDEDEEELLNFVAPLSSAVITVSEWE